MADEELTLILRLRDEATKQMKSARAGIVAAGAAIAAAGFTAGKKWDDATKTIVSGTGATGKALAGLQKDYQSVAKYGDGAAAAIADLNTHLGLEGDALRMVAEAALKAKVDTNLFGDVASQMGLDAEGASELLDQLTVASQGSGVSIDAMTQGIGRNSARWVNAGGDMKDLTAKVVELSFESGPSGLRGAMSEVFEEVDKGVMPAIVALTDQLTNTTGAVERTYGAGKTWRDTLREMKDGALAYLGPGGDMVGAIGSAASGLALAGPQMLKWIKGVKVAAVAQRAFNVVMRLNPIGLIVTAITLVGLALYTWRDQIWSFLKGAWNGLVKGLEHGYNFIARLVPGMEEVSFAAKTQFTPAVEEAAVATEHAAEALAGPSSVSLVPALATAKVEVDYFTGSVEDSSAALGHWGLEISKIGTQVEPIPPFMSTLTGSIEDQSAALGAWGVSADAFGVSIEKVPLTLNEALTGKALPIVASFADSVKELAGRIPGHFIDAFKGGGGFAGALKAVLIDAFDFALSAVKAFLGSWAASVGGWFGKIFGGAANSGIASSLGGAGAGAAGGAAGGAGAGAAGGGAAGAGGGIFSGVTAAGLASAGIIAAAFAAPLILVWLSESPGEAATNWVEAWKKANPEVRQLAIESGNSVEHVTKAWNNVEAAQGSTLANAVHHTRVMEHMAGEMGNAWGEAMELAALRSDDALALVREQSQVTVASIETNYARLPESITRSISDPLWAIGNMLDNVFSDRTVKVKFKYDTSGRPSGVSNLPNYDVPGLQHGGPVSAGSAYRVGEKGEEIFVPGQSGSVVPNKSIPTAEEIGAAVASAMQRAPIVVPQDPVTDALYRNGPRRAALKGYA